METGQPATRHRPGNGALWGCGCLKNSGGIAVSANERRRFITMPSGLARTQREDPKFRCSCRSSIADQRDPGEERRALALVFLGLTDQHHHGYSTITVNVNP